MSCPSWSCCIRNKTAPREKKRFKEWHKGKKWVIRADTHQVLSNTTFFPILKSVEARLHFCSTAASSFRRHSEVLVVIFHRIKNQKFQVADKTVSKMEHEYRGRLLRKSTVDLPPPKCPRPAHLVVVKFFSLVLVELEVEAAARLEGVKVEGPGGSSSSSSALLVFRVQGILARVKLLPHFWQDDGKKG